MRRLSEKSMTRGTTATEEPVGFDLVAAKKLVLRYLSLLESRQLDAAQACLADDVLLVFPGGREYKSIANWAAAGATRYLSVAKAIEICEGFASEGSTYTVYVCGTLHGTWLDGKHFSHIRFIDRFVVGRDGIRRQAVWNDAGEVRAAREVDQ